MANGFITKGLDEDEVSDISNDCLFLEAIRGDLAKALESKVPAA
jgi:hypothetical protein